jgi:hypothetical protein
MLALPNPTHVLISDETFGGVPSNPEKPNNEERKAE